MDMLKPPIVSECPSAREQARKVHVRKQNEIDVKVSTKLSQVNGVE